MTFLLFLVSVAVIEYLVGRQPRMRNPRQEVRGTHSVKQLDIPAPAQPTPGLYALGEALNRLGEGEKPGLRAQPQTTGSKSESA